MFNRLLIGTDGSADALEAVRFGAKIARDLGAGVVLVYAETYPSYAVGLAPMTQADTDVIRQAGEEVLKRSAAPLDEHGVEYESKILRGGGAADTILDYAEQEGIDAIVIGRRGLGAWGRFFLGSVSSKIVHLAKCVVLVAPVIEHDAD